MDRMGKGRKEERKDEIQTQCFNGEDAWAFDYYITARTEPSHMH